MTTAQDVGVGSSRPESVVAGAVAVAGRFTSFHEVMPGHRQQVRFRRRCRAT